MDDMTADIRFVTLAATLRPRLGAVMNWAAGGDVVATARSFIEERSSRLDTLLSGVLVRAIAALERYIRQLVEDAVNTAATNAKTYERLSETISQRNMVLTGRVLASSDTPRDHLSFDYEQLIENLASCRAGRTEFRLNGSAFAAVVTNASPTVVERALKSVDIENWLDAVGRDATLEPLVKRRSRAIRPSGLNSASLSFGGGIKLRTAVTKRPFSLRKCFKKVSTSSVLLRWHSIARFTHSWQSGRRPDFGTTGRRWPSNHRGLMSRAR